ncbi:MAG: peptide chain release factor 1 [Deltaproteobacteria bacterium]|nr:peptide chain release factor 1 [Deltaproteobacteria bacterium]
MFQKLEQVDARYRELDGLLCDPDVLGDRERYHKLSKERADIADVVTTYRAYRDLVGRINDNRELLNDPEMRELAKAELDEDLLTKDDLEKRLKILLLPKDPNDDKNVMLELRAGTGGEEASLFASDLLRMYSRFAERHQWKTEMLSLSQSSSGGIKEAIALISGDKVYSRLKFESGVHRVQRVPATESQGRIHTSTATVAVLPEAEDVDVQINEKDLKIDVMRAGGPGGQSVNTTDSAVRITHIPSGMVVVCQDEKSQHKNKAKALRILRSRLLEQEQQKQQEEQRDARRAQVGSGERSEKIRTYNFPQDRLTDHRIGFSRHNLQAVLDGDFTDLLDAVRTHFQAEALRGSSDNE